MNTLKKFGICTAAAAVTGLVLSAVVMPTGSVTSTLTAAGAQTETTTEATAESTSTEENSSAVTLGADASDTTGTTKTSTSTESTASIADVAAEAMPSMVAITNTTVENIQGYFGGYGAFGGSEGQSVESVSMGTGVIIGETDDEILIATNAHVIADATELSVAFVDESAAEAEVVGSDTADDLAVISVSKDDLSDDTLDAIAVIKIGDSDDLVVGEEVVAIGNALGYGQSVSAGIVSALNRTIDSENASAIGLIQTDAAINPGNSGGALLNMNGELIGINSSKYADTDVEGMGYAIPITEAKEILEDLINGSSDDASGTTQVSGSSDAYLGISCATISDEYAQYYGIPSGVYVDSVVSGQAAENAGIQSGDIITAIDGTEVASADELTALLANYSSGDTITVTVMRAANGFTGSSNYVSGDLTVTLGSRSQMQTSASMGIAG